MMEAAQRTRLAHQVWLISSVLQMNPLPDQMLYLRCLSTQCTVIFGAFESSPTFPSSPISHRLTEWLGSGLFHSEMKVIFVYSTKSRDLCGRFSPLGIHRPYIWKLRVRLMPYLKRRYVILRLRQNYTMEKPMGYGSIPSHH